MCVCFFFLNDKWNNKPDNSLTTYTLICLPIHNSANLFISTKDLSITVSVHCSEGLNQYNFLHCLWILGSCFCRIVSLLFCFLHSIWNIFNDANTGVCEGCLCWTLFIVRSVQIRVWGSDSGQAWLHIFFNRRIKLFTLHLEDLTLPLPYSRLSQLCPLPPLSRPSSNTFHHLHISTTGRFCCQGARVMDWSLCFYWSSR